MRLPMTILLAAALLPACSRVDDGPGSAPAASPASTESPAAIEPPPGGWQDTMAAGTQDPRGSNCFGIFPEQCGADKAAAHIGETMTRSLAARLEAMAPGGARIIRPGQAVTDDLRYARLNVHLDEQDRIEEVDCY